MAVFQVYSKAGLNFGRWEAETPEDAIAALNSEAGGESTPKDWIIEEVIIDSDDDNDGDSGENRAKACAEACYQDIIALLQKGEPEEIIEYPLEVSVRSGWCSLGSKLELAEYRIILCTGYPEVRIWGYLDTDGCPVSADIQFRDWGTEWVTYYSAKNDINTVLRFARIIFGG